jgi:hydrogenase-4 component F
LSGYFILVIAVVSLLSSLYSIKYIADDIKENVLSDKTAVLYYILFNIFVLTMIFTTVVNNLGIMWVSIELTTLVSAFLVGIYNKEASVEAAWKYIIICSVGISLALLGIILLYYTVSTDGRISTLNWTDILAVSKSLNPEVVKIAFIFILIGYGTKAGLVPMHTWLPDAHSQALAPISAMLSGVLLKTSIYAIIRYMVIANKCLSTDFTGHLLIIFGLISVLIPAGFMLVQKDLKRLLAYSSIEHIGVICFGLGVGGPLGLFGALFHVFNHAINKSMMFFSAGNIIRKYKTHNMKQVSGMLKAMPFTGTFAALGIFALCGMPPFSVFFSELMILISGFSRKNVLPSAILVIALAAIFGAMVYHFSKMFFGKSNEEVKRGESLDVYTKTAFVCAGLLVAVFGLYRPEYFINIIKSAIKVIQG